MIKSMTGYGIHRSELPDKKISVEIKSVNHRYSDFNIRTPRYYAFLDELIRQRLSGSISRGKVDVYVSIDWQGGQDRALFVNKELAAGYVTALRDLRNAFGLEGDVTLEHLTRFPDIFNPEQMDFDTETVWREVSETLDLAVRGFVAMRQEEGKRLAQDILERAAAIKESLKIIEKRTPHIINAYTERLRTRMTELLGSVPYDENRLIAEIAVFSDKTDINEELVRLESHVDQLCRLVQSEQPIGRKLDFLIQELNREINTIGSKSNDIDISRIVVEMKTELEKLREQAQNIE